MRVRNPLRVLYELATGSFLDKGLRFGIRARFIALVAVMFFVFALVLFFTFSTRIRNIFVEELYSRVNVQVEYLSSYGIVLVGNPNQENLASLLKPVLDDKDLEYLTVQSVRTDEPIFARFKDVKLRSVIIDRKPVFVEQEPVQSEQAVGGLTIIHTAIPIYQQSVEMEGLDEIETLFEEESMGFTLDEALEGDMDLGYDQDAGDLGGGSLDDEATDTEVEQELVGWILYGVSTGTALRQISRVNYESITMTIGFLVVMILVMWILIAMGFVPLVRMAEASHTIAAGDLRANVDIDSDDEIGDLAQSFNRMVDRMRNVIERVQTTSKRMQMVAHQIDAASEQVRAGGTAQSEGIEDSLRSLESLNASIKEISDNVNQLTESAEESSASVYELNETIKEVDANMEHLSGAVSSTVQIINETSEMHKQNVISIDNLRQGTEETASSMSQIDSSINEIRDHSKLSADTARGMFEEAQTGKSAVDQTISGLDAIRIFSEEMNTVVGGLENKGSEISKIVEVIYDVADQTNLLALNASIIAAQAGDKGRAFAVVAMQIKELSNRTVDSIQQINRLISSMQEEVGRASESMRAGNRTVSDGVVVAQQAGDALSSILKKAEDVLMTSQQIERSTTEHARGAHQVRQATDQIRDMVGQIQSNIQAQEEKNSVLRDSAGKMKNISIHVKGTTREQAAGSRLIKESIEKITSMVHEIDQRVTEQRTSTSTVVESAIQVRGVADQTVDHMTQLDEVVNILGEQIELLTEVVGEFIVQQRSPE